MENFLNKIQGNDNESEASSCHEDELSLLRATNAMLSRTAERQKRALVNVERVLGQYFAGLDPKILEHSALDTITAPFRIPRMQREAIMVDYSSHDSVGVVDAAIQAIEMHPLLVEALEVLREAVHIRASLAGQAVYYSISHFALYQMPKSILVEHIAESVARQLVVQLDSLWRNDND